MTPKQGPPIIHDKPNRNMRLRATNEEWTDFMSMLKGNTRERFIQIRKAIRKEEVRDTDHLIEWLFEYIDKEFSVQITYNLEDIHKELGI